MRKRSSAAAVACTSAAAAAALASTATGFLGPAPVSRPLAQRSGSRSSHRGFSSQLGQPLSQPAALVGRAPAVALTAAGRRDRRRHATRTSMVFGSGGGGGRGGGGFRLDPGTIATIGFGLLFVFAPGFIFGAFNTLFLVVTVGPILFSVGLNLYNKFNLVDAPCPVCGVELQGLKNKQNQCPNCGAMILAQNGKFEAVGSGYVRDEAGAQQKFSRMADSGVIDVDAIDVDD